MSEINIWEEMVNSINDVKLGFIVALVLGYCFYRLSKKVADTVPPTDDALVS